MSGDCSNAALESRQCRRSGIVRMHGSVPYSRCDCDLLMQVCVQAQNLAIILLVFTSPPTALKFRHNTMRRYVLYA